MARSDRRQRRLLVVAAVATSCFVVACNAITGLGDYGKGECAGGACAPPTDDANVPDVVSEDAGIDAPGASPVSWAKWPMPNYGDGGDGGPPLPPNLEVDGDEVLDHVTKLVWRRAPLEREVQASQAEAACRALPGGLWRAPKRIELVTLLDFAGSTVKVNVNAFDPTLGSARVWSTSEVRPYDSAAPSYWSVDFEVGSVEPSAATLLRRVLCVKASQ